ncbi:MAG: MoaD/ThiS family protein [Pirellulaceae bacterium]
MIVRVRLFAAARQVAERDVVEMEVPESATVADVRQQLTLRYPGLEAWTPHLLFALNHRYVSDDSPVPPDAELASFPPVSGG